MIKNIFLVAMGSAAGGVLRYLVSLIPLNNNSQFPFLTLLVNVFGCFLLGILTLFSVKILSPSLSLFLCVGLCGGFTTFSTFTRETFLLFQSNSLGLGIAYVFASFCLSFLAFWLPFLLWKP